MSMFYGAGSNIFKNAHDLRNHETVAEKILWKYISKNQVGLKFRRQHPINKYVADFYCHKIKLVIELDGSIHDQRGQREYDENREFELKEFGINILRFSNEDVFNRIDDVLDKINEYIKSRDAGD
jgi:imidazole glycerol-phosphate synthase subunit HisF